VTTQDIDPLAESGSFEYSIDRIAGGGSLTYWEWHLFEKGSPVPIESGLVKGEQKSVVLAVQAAASRLRRRQTRQRPVDDSLQQQLAKF
jgi:hypothetical protein